MPGGPNDAFDGEMSDTRVMDQRESVISGVSDQDEGTASAVTSHRPMWERALPWVMALVFASLYATISIARFERFGTKSFDVGIFEQAIRHYAHLQAPIVDLEGVGHNFLGDHWNPAIAVFAPFYRLFPTTVTLLVGQALLIALAVVPITRAGMRHLGRWSGVAVGLAFGMSYGIQSAVDFDIHEVALAVPLVAFALEALLARRWVAVVAWAAPLVLVKEDLGLTVAAIGVVLVLVGARRWGLALGAFGLVWFALTITVLIPHFNAEGRYTFWAGVASQPGTGSSLLQRVLDLPLAMVTPGPKGTTVLLLLVVTVFLGLRSPLLILVLPTLGWRFISTNENYWGQFFHYDLILMPIVFAALVDGAMRARRGRWGVLRWYARAAPALALLVAVFFCTRYAFKDLVDPATYQAGPRAEAAGRVLAKIPDDATVETDPGLMAHLTSRTRVFYAGKAAPMVPQFVLIDGSWNPGIPDAVKYAESLHPGTSYERVLDDGGYRLVRRRP